MYARLSFGIKNKATGKINVWLISRYEFDRLAEDPEEARKYIIDPVVDSFKTFYHDSGLKDLGLETEIDTVIDEDYTWQFDDPEHFFVMSKTVEKAKKTLREVELNPLTYAE